VELEKDVIGDTSGCYKKALVALLAAGRETSGAEPVEAAKEAQELYEAGAAHWGTDESTFTKILCNRSYEHLRILFAAYEKLHGKTMEQVIKSETSGNLEEVYLTIVAVARDPVAFWAAKLYHSMKGLGTDEHTLVRVIAGRAPIDMVEIRDHFQKTYTTSLADMIKGDTSGDFKKILLALVD